MTEGEPPVVACAGQRCHVSVLFADVCGYTALNERCDPEELYPVLEEIRLRVERVVKRHGGVVNEWRGDGVLCVFGLPHADERDARRAIQAALEIHESVRGLTVALPGEAPRSMRLHTGVDSGLVFVRDGDMQRGRYELIGDTVNTAARLCAAANADEIFAAETTLQGIEEFFETEPMAPLQLKGKRESVRAWKVRARTGIVTRFRASVSRGLTPLVGRREHLERLVELLGEVERKGLQVVDVIGPPGIGKTRLLEELQTRASACSVQVLAGYSENAESALPLQPFLQMLAQVAHLEGSERSAASDGAERRVSSEAQPTQFHVGRLQAILESRQAAPRPDPDALQRAIIDEFDALFTSLTQGRRLLLLLDDWQWADDSSTRVLATVIGRLRDRPVLVVVAGRGPADPFRKADHVVELLPFTRDESERAVGALFPHAFDLGIVAALHQQSGGNALYLEELCRAVLSESPASEEDLVRAVPATLNGLIRERVARLPPRDAAVVHAAAVLGGDFSLPLLRLLTVDLEPAVSADELARSEVVYSSAIHGTFRFRHGITREVVYDSIRLSERRRLHASAARALENGSGTPGAAEALEALAYHHAGAQDHERAAAYAERAGDKARATSSLDRARKHYRAALEALDKLEGSREQRQRWVAVAAKLATAWLYRPAREAFLWLERMGSYAEELGNAHAAARADYWLGWFHYAYGEQDLAMRHYQRALERAHGLDDLPLEEQLFLNQGQSLAAASEYAEADAHFERALAMRSARGATWRSNPFGLAYALSTRGMMYGELGEFDRAYRYVSEALRLVEGTGHPTDAACQGALCLVQLLQADFTSCLEMSVRTRAEASRVGAPFIFAQNQVIAGYSRWLLEGSREGFAEMIHGCQWLERRRLFLFGSFTLAHVADALLRARSIEQATQYAQRALERAAHRDTSGEALAHRTLAGVHAQTNAPDAARAALARAFDCARRGGSRREMALTQMCAIEHGTLEGEALANAVAEATTAFREMKMPFHERQLATVVAALKGRS